MNWEEKFRKLNENSSINIDGTILICNELCKLKIKYNNEDSLKCENNGDILHINVSDNNNFVEYNGAITSNNKDTTNNRYFLTDIFFSVRNKNWIQSKSYPMQINLVHESDDRKKFLIIGIMVDIDHNNNNDKCSPIFKIIKDNFPLKNRGTKIVDNKSWIVSDLLPNENDRSFFTYSLDGKNNWIVFDKPIMMPVSFYTDYLNKVLGKKKSNKLYLDMDMTPKPRDSNLVIFGNRNKILTTYEQFNNDNSDNNNDDDSDNDDDDDIDHTDDSDDNDDSNNDINDEDYDNFEENNYILVIIFVSLLTILGAYIFNLYYDILTQLK